jgi:hypothetical protein
MGNRITLTLVFTLSFLSYMTEDLSFSLQLVPLILFAILVFFKVICSKPLVETVGSVFERDGLIYILLVSILMISPSVASGIDRSLETALVISVCALLARIYMTAVSIQEVFEAFFWSGVVSVVLIISLGFGALMQSLATLARFSLFSFHPNLLAFVLAGYFCATAWKFWIGNWYMKILTAVIGLIDLVVIFFASSRGSIAGILAGVACVIAIAIIGAEERTRRRLMRIAAAGLVLLFLLFLSIQSRAWVQETYTFVDAVLQLTQDQRGIDSGFSGRFDKWDRTLRVLSDGSWLFGHGVRSSDLMEDNFIDNSYLVMLYEVGVVTISIVTWRYVSILRRLLRNYFKTRDRMERCFFLGATLLIIVFLANNIVARFLFSVGNPYSLVALLFFVTPTRLLAIPANSRVAEGHSIGIAGPPIQTLSHEI